MIHNAKTQPEHTTIRTDTIKQDYNNNPNAIFHHHMKTITQVTTTTITIMPGHHC